MNTNHFELRRCSFLQWIVTDRFIQIKQTHNIHYNLLTICNIISTVNHFAKYNRSMFKQQSVSKPGLYYKTKKATLFLPSTVYFRSSKQEIFILNHRPLPACSFGITITSTHTLPVCSASTKEQKTKLKQTV